MTRLEVLGVFASSFHLRRHLGELIYDTSGDGILKVLYATSGQATASTEVVPSRDITPLAVPSPVSGQ
jgi:hypothetical protein